MSGEANNTLINGCRLTEPAPVPHVAEQQEIARILRTVDEKVQAEERRKEALFKTLIRDLLTACRRLLAEFVRRFEGGTRWHSG